MIVIGEKREKNKILNKKEIKIFSWNKDDLLKCILGLFLTSLATNLFIVPNNFYTGGILGLAQLIRSAITPYISFKFDISSIIYYLINIPLFLMAYKDLSRTFSIRTLFAVTINSLFLAIIPIPQDPLIQNMLANVLIGGIMSGIGIGIVLSTGSSTGGTDIIGITISKKNKRITVGLISLIFNVIVYSICGIFFGIETMLYSIMISIFESLNIDRYHMQNICSSAIIFTKKEPEEIIEYINNNLNRGATYWETIGGYTKTRTYIVYTVISKYERMRLERHVKGFDSNAFMVSDDGLEVSGHFEKYLI